MFPTSAAIEVHNYKNTLSLSTCISPPLPPTFTSRRKYVEKCMHSKGLRKTFDKIVEVIRDVMARTVCLMDQQHTHGSKVGYV